MMMKRPLPDLIDLALRWILAAVFLAAALPKIAQPGEFALSVFRYQIVPHGAVNAVAVFLPWLELVCALALIAAPSLRRGALALLLGMLAVFTAAIAFNLYRGIDIACGCFSVGESGGHIGAWNIARNIALIAAAGFCHARALAKDLYRKPPRG